MTTATGPATVSIGGGPFGVVSPPVPLLDRLAVRRLEPAVRNGTDLGWHAVPLVGIGTTLLGEPVQVFWAGLVRVVSGLLKARGVPVAARGPEPRGRLAPDPDAVREVGDPGVVLFTARVSRGLVRYDPEKVDVLGLAARVCRAYPNARIVVVVARRADGVALRRLLRAAGVAAVLATGRHPGEAGRVTVCTLGASGRAGIDRADLVLVLDALRHTWADPAVEPPIPHEVYLDPAAVSAGGRDPRLPRPVGLMDRLDRTGPVAAVVGFLPLDRVTSRFEHARAWQLYGFDEVVVPRHGAVERMVVTAAESVRLRATIPAGADDLAVKKAVWADPIRARRLARLARLLRAGDRVGLGREFPEAAAGQANCGGSSNCVPRMNITPSPNFTPKAVLVLVEGVDQAKAFGRALPGWPVVTGLGGDDPIQNSNGGVIATALGVEKIAGGAFDVVVRADPGKGPLQLPSGLLESNAPAPRPLLLVDAEDRGHSLPALWSRMRRRAYLRAGWVRAGADTDVAAWERFQALVLDRGDRP